jgi:hypothetical protein
LNPWLLAMYQTATPVLAPTRFLPQNLVTALVFLGIGARLALVWALGSVLAEIGERAKSYQASEAARGLPTAALLMLFSTPALGLAGFLGPAGIAVLLFNALVLLIAWATLFIAVTALSATLSAVASQHRHARRQTPAHAPPRG